MDNIELYKLAYKCLICIDNPKIQEEVKSMFYSNQINFERFIHLCSDHLILPAIYFRLNKFDLIDLFPNSLAAHLKDIYYLNLARNKGIIKQSIEINSNLNKYNIEPVYLKGTANLFDKVYIESGDRMIGDIDILVKENDYFLTAELIQKLGYKHEKVKIFDNLDEIRHYPRLFRDDVAADIEIHRAPVDKMYTKKYNSIDIFNAKKCIVNFENCFVPSDNHKLIHTFIHSQLSNMGHIKRYPSLRDVYDFYLLTKRVNFNKLLPQFEEKNKAKIFYNLSNQILINDKNNYASKDWFIFVYYKQLKWLINHPKHHSSFVKIIKMNEIFIKRPFYKIKYAAISKTRRKGLYRRLLNPEWYRFIIRGIQSYFR